MKVSILGAWGATVGDNVILKQTYDYVESLGHTSARGYEKDCDVLIYGPGGLLWDYTLPKLIEQIKEAQSNNIPCYGIGLGYQGISNYDKFKFLEDFELVTVRDSYSKELLEEHLDLDSISTYDVGFDYKVPKNKQNNEIAVCVPRIQNFNELKYALSEIEGKKKLISLSPPMDKVNLNGYKVIKHNTNPIKELTKCDILISGSLHSTIFGITSGTPMVITPVRDKIRFLCNETNLNKYNAIIRDEIVSKVKYVKKHKEKTKKDLVNVKQKQKRYTRSNFTILKNILGST